MPKRWPEYFDAPEHAWMDVAGSASLGGQVDASSWSICQGLSPPPSLSLFTAMIQNQKQERCQP